MMSKKELVQCHIIIQFGAAHFKFVQEYKPPSSKDIPLDFRVELLKDAPNPIGVLGSKGIPPAFNQSIQDRISSGYYMY